ncbi:MAG: hypothetical protein HY898_34025 [Deltaproteobacteria bacterium]|nr:hypothetical protein [Deltaproteobacteria bacterium]
MKRIVGFWGKSGKDVFAAGMDGQILHYDGNLWQSTQTVAALEAVWATDSAVFAVSRQGDVLLFERGAWRVLHRSGGDLSTIWASGPDAIFAVGGVGRISHYNGREWTTTAGNLSHDLHVVFGTSSMNVLVGASMIPNTVMRFDGHSWRPEPDFECHEILGMWGLAADSIFATCGDGSGGVYHYNGSVWNRQTDGENLVAVWGTSSRDIFAVGATIRHFDGERWTTQSRDGPFRGVWGSGPRDVFASTQAGAVLHYDGLRWRIMSRLSDLPLSGVAGSGPNDVFVVGAAGRVFHYDGHSWAAQISATDLTLHAVSALGPRDVYAVGEDGVILHYDGSAWSRETSGTDHQLYSVWATKNDIFVVGSLGTILHKGRRLDP